MVGLVIGKSGKLNSALGCWSCFILGITGQCGIFRWIVELVCHHATVSPALTWCQWLLTTWLWPKHDFNCVLSLPSDVC